jgi:hypothetical protein
LKAIIVQPDGSYETIQCTDSYQTIKHAVGGWLEAVSSTDDTLTFWCNEEGKLKGLQPNPAATYLWWAAAPHMTKQDILVGPVVMTGGADPHGETLGLTDEQVSLIEGYLCS